MLSTTWTLSRMVHQNWRSIRLLINILGTSLNLAYSERIFLVLTLSPSSSLVTLPSSYSSSLAKLIVARRRRRFCDLLHRASLCDPVKHHISNWIFHCTYIHFIIQERYCIWCTRRRWQVARMILLRRSVLLAYNIRFCNSLRLFNFLGYTI